MHAQQQDSEGTPSHVPTRTTASGNSHKKNYKLFVGGVPVELSDDELYQIVRSSIQGECVVQIVRNPEQGNSKGCAKVEVKNKQDFEYLIKNKIEIKGRLLQVDKYLENEAEKKIVMLENNKKILHIGGLSPEVSELDLKEYFSKFGNVERAYIVFHLGEVKKSRGFGFVEFAHKKDAKKVLEQKSHIMMGKEVTVTQKKTKSDLKKETGSAITPLSKGNASRDGKTSQSGSLSNMGSVSANAHSKGYSLPADKKSVNTLGSHKPKSNQQYYGGYPPSFVTPSKMGGVSGSAFSGQQFPPNVFPEDPRLQFSGGMPKNTTGSSSSHSAKKANQKQPKDTGSPWSEMHGWLQGPPGMYPPMPGDWNTYQPAGYQMSDNYTGKGNPEGGSANPQGHQPNNIDFQAMRGYPGMPQPPNFMFPLGPHQLPQAPPNASNPMMMKPGQFNQWSEAPQPVESLEDFANQGESTVKSLPYKFTPKPVGTAKATPLNYQKQMQRVIHLPPDHHHHHMQQRGPPMQPPMGFPPGLGLQGFPPGPAPPGFGAPMNYYPPGGNFPGGPRPGPANNRVPPYPGEFQYRIQPSDFPAGAQKQPLKAQPVQPVRVLPRPPGPNDQFLSSGLPFQQAPTTNRPENNLGPVAGSDNIDINSFVRFMDQDGSDGEREPQTVPHNQQ